jgi:hypothetical protein
MRELETLARLPNFWLWLSADGATKLPPVIPGVRGVAWMQAIGENLEWMKNIGPGRPWFYNRLLVFPVKDKHREPVKRIGLAMVCPHYSGAAEDKVGNCEACGFCFSGAGDYEAG